MLVKQACSSKIIEKVEDIDFNMAFIYRNESMSVEYSNLEEVFSVSRRESESHSVVLVESLNLKSDEDKRKLLELLKSESLLLEIVESKRIKEYFSKNSLHEYKRFIDNLHESEKDELLLSLFYKEVRQLIKALFWEEKE